MQPHLSHTQMPSVLSKSSLPHAFLTSSLNLLEVEMPTLSRNGDEYLEKVQSLF